MRIKKYYKLIKVDYEDSAYMRLKNVSNEIGIFKMVKNGSPTVPNLEYSLDGVTWTTYDFSTLPEVTVAPGANIYFRGTNANQQFNKNTYSAHYFSFDFNKICEAHGNICSLFNPDPAVFSTITSIGDDGLYGIFYGCTSLTIAPDLGNVTSIGINGLKNAFHGCTSLTIAPDFSNVTSIGQTGLETTFINCTSLTIAPDFSNVTSIGIGGMRSTLWGCTSLTTGPDLSNVTSIGQAGLQNIFHNCSKISTVTAPNVQDLTANNILNSWLDSAGTQATGTKTVRVPTGATIAANSTSGIPIGWTRVDY